MYWMHCLRDCGDKMQSIPWQILLSLKYTYTHIPVSVCKVANICKAERISGHCLCFLLSILHNVTSVAPSPQWAKATTEQINRDRDGRWEGKRERRSEREHERLCVSERDEGGQWKTEEVKCSLGHHNLFKDLKQTDAVTVAHLTQDNCFDMYLATDM